MSGWAVGNFCKNCHKEIKYSTKMYNQGVCPYCMNSSGGTMVDCYIRLYKDLKTSPWWKFWKVETHRVYYTKESQDVTTSKKGEKIMSIVKNETACDGPTVTVKTDLVNSATINLFWKDSNLKTGRIIITPDVMPFSRSFDFGTAISLKALPKKGFIVNGWSNGKTGDQAGFKVTKDVIMIANMEEGTASEVTTDPGDFSSAFKRKAALTEDEIAWLRANVLPK